MSDRQCERKKTNDRRNSLPYSVEKKMKSYRRWDLSHTLQNDKEIRLSLFANDNKHTHTHNKTESYNGKYDSSIFYLFFGTPKTLKQYSMERNINSPTVKMKKLNNCEVLCILLHIGHIFKQQSTASFIALPCLQ